MGYIESMILNMLESGNFYVLNIVVLVITFFIILLIYLLALKFKAKSILTNIVMTPIILLSLIILVYINISGYKLPKEYNLSQIAKTEVMESKVERVTKTFKNDMILVDGVEYQEDLYTKENNQKIVEGQDIKYKGFKGYISKEGKIEIVNLIKIEKPKEDESDSETEEDNTETEAKEDKG